jgi:hypothetical protein
MAEGSRSTWPTPGLVVEEVEEEVCFPAIPSVYSRSLPTL